MSQQKIECSTTSHSEASSIDEEESSAAAANASYPRRTRTTTRRTKLIKLASGIGFFLVLLSIILVGIGLIIPITKPVYRIQSLTNIQDFNVSDGFSSQFFHMKLMALVTLKNSNFGAYKFDDTNLTFSYMGTTVGEAAIHESRVHIFSRKNARIAVNISSESIVVPAGNLNLSMDIGSGMLPLSGRSQLGGKMEYLKVIRRYKSATLNCNFTINLLSKALQKLRCD